MARWEVLPVLLVALLLAGTVAGPDPPIRAANPRAATALEWQNETGGPAPPAGAGTTMAYDSVADRFIWFGGWNGSTFNETWVLDPGTGSWTQLRPALAPRARADAAFVFDPVNEECYLFGGWAQLPNGTVVRLNDTWAFSLAADQWTEEFPSAAPSPRSDSGAAFDVALGRMLLFGGFSGTTYLGDEWTYDPVGNAWSPVPPTGPWPAPRADGRLTYDSDSGALLLFGGNDYSGPNLTFHHLADTWSLDPTGTRWHLVEPHGSPPARDYAVQAYDPTTGSFLLYGGFGNRTFLGDLWAYAPGNTTWWQVGTTDAPPPRYAGVGGYAPEDDLFVVVGGLGPAGLLNDTWAVLLPVAGSPVPGEFPWALVGAFAGPVAFLAAIGGVNRYRHRRARSP